ncbi:hypothetical protein GCM10022243_43340 [Saccharothrix violaceirubra]
MSVVAQPVGERVAEPGKTISHPLVVLARAPRSVQHPDPLSLAQLATEHPTVRDEARLRVDCLRVRVGRPWDWAPTP